MITVYTVCAVAGSVVLVVQFILMLMGIDGDDIETGHGHDSTWFFGVVSMKSLVAALAFFGLTGRVLEAGGWAPALVFIGALSGGAIAMLLVAWMMRLLVSLRHEGNIQIEQAVGLPGRVYLSVPGHRAGMGKVTMSLQERSVEFEAVTDEDTIPTGANVIVVGIVNDSTVEVRPEAALS